MKYIMGNKIIGRLFCILLFLSLVNCEGTGGSGSGASTPSTPTPTPQPVVVDYCPNIPGVANLSNCNLVVNDDTTSESAWKDTFTYLQMTGKQTGNNELEDYVPDQDKFKSGTDLDSGLNLQLVPNPTVAGHYLSGAVITKKPVTDYAKIYGYAEMNVVLPHNLTGVSNPYYAQGLWPAIWMIPVAGAPVWPSSGEIDFMELMEKAADNPQNPIVPSGGFSTLHFGPNYESDIGGGEGLRVESYSWNDFSESYDKPMKYAFMWHKIKNTSESPNYFWQISMFLNDQLVWTKNMNYNDMQLKQAINSSPVYQESSGDPVIIFNKALNNHNSLDGYHMKINLAFGGSPFKGKVDTKLQTATFTIKSFKIWNISESDPEPTPPPEEKRPVRVCNSYTTKPIWYGLFSSDLGMWKKSTLVPPNTCDITNVGKDYGVAQRVYIFDKDQPDISGLPDPNTTGFQLLEYTFRYANDKVGNPYGVNYDYSAVDTIYTGLPVAMEVTDGGATNFGYGYTGNYMTDEHDAVLDPRLSKDFNSVWSSYASSDISKNIYNFPGGANFINQSLSDPNVKNLVTRWAQWFGGVDGVPAYSCNTDPNPIRCNMFQAYVQDVVRSAGYNHYDTLEDFHTTVKNIIGWTYGDKNPDQKNEWINFLAKGTPDSEDAYPDYSSMYCLNPYTTFIHKVLQMNVYSFSVDDSEGDPDTGALKDNSGVTIDVGGTSFLAVKCQYNKARSCKAP